MIGLAEVVKEPNSRFIFSWAYQLFESEQQQLLLVEKELFPRPTGYDAETIPTFQQILNFLQKSNESTGQTIGVVEYNIDGTERILAWYIHGADSHRQITLLLLDEPIQTFLDRHRRGPDPEYPGLRLRTDEEKRQNPLGHSPERLTELKQYTGEVRGRFLKKFIKVFITASATFAILLSFFWWQSHSETTVMLKFYELYLMASLLVAGVLGLQAKLTRVEIAEGAIRFYFAGRLRKEVKLALIDGYTYQHGSRGPIRIISVSDRYSPSGLIDHKQLTGQLESCGIQCVEPG